MFCYQCEQTAKGTGCTIVGSCGKDTRTAALQDLLLQVTKGIAEYAHRARQLGVQDHEVDVFTVQALFATGTNVNFDPDRLQESLARGMALKDKARERYFSACAQAGIEPVALNGTTTWSLHSADLEREAEEVTILRRREALGEDVAGLQETLTYCLKGVAAYAEHARVLGVEDDAIYAAIHESLSYLGEDQPTVEGLLSQCLKAGETNLRAMEILDTANTSRYGHPVPGKVRITPVAGKAILVSGHDLRDLEELLRLTEGTGINVYTHGEMLPAHGYPKLKACQHLVGNYGGAWQDQAKEFARFPGAILMTTNCIQQPRESYKARIFTSGHVAWPGVTHIADRDFAPLIEAALAAPGFAEDAPAKTILVGFGHEAVLGVADKVLEAVKSGAIRHFFLIGGCDGAKSGRNYFTELAQAVPDDAVILTLACGKYRFNKLEFGSIGGLPRLLDIGQCNDAYSAIRVAVALAEALNCGVNDLPLSMILSWYEQKAVAVLFTLLHLGIKNIRLGPSLPAFISPKVLGELVDKYGIKATTTAEADLAAILGPRQQATM